MAPCWGPHWQSSLAIVAAVLLAAGPVGILAQTSTVTCLSSFSVMDNTAGQDPCQVAAYLQGACNNGQWSIGPLPPNTHYIGPLASESNPCQCSSVTYSTISACGLCQNRTIIDWSTWSTNCTTTYLQTFPQGIPDGTAVPAWAYENVSIGDVFNLTLALSIGDQPESTAVQSTTSSTTSTPSSSATLTSTPTDTTSSTPSPAVKSSNTAAIAGGVVGGVAGVALIAAAVVFFVLRRNRSQVPLSTQYTGTDAPMSPTNRSTSYTDSGLFSSQMVQPRLYDPTDPSTFPPSSPPAGSGLQTSGSSYNPSSSLNHSSPSVRPGAYTGAPEV